MLWSAGTKTRTYSVTHLNEIKQCWNRKWS